MDSSLTSRGSVDSFSGHERDHFFVNLEGERFIDLGGIYGLDHPGDGRTVAILDYDRDGWMDFAVASSNKPSLQLYRNKIGEISAQQPRFIALRLEGGNKSATASTGLSPRDGYGARIDIETSGGSQSIEARCGEGRSAVHSKTLIVGLGEDDVADQVIVRWPSGTVTKTGMISSGTLLTVYELSSDSPDGSGTHSVIYESVERKEQRDSEPLVTVGAPEDELRVYVTMTTTCAACLRAKPSIEKLKSACADDGVGFYGVSVDASEGPDTLKDYIDKRKPPYEVLSELSSEEVDVLREAVKTRLGYESTPSTIVTDKEGRVLDVRAGIPSLSVLRKCLDEQGRGR